MVVLCNGKEIKINAGTTLLAYIENENLNPDTVVAQCNGVVINRADYPSHILTSGCTVELIGFVGGG